MMVIMSLVTVGGQHGILKLLIGEMAQKTILEFIVSMEIMAG